MSNSASKDSKKFLDSEAIPLPPKLCHNPIDKTVVLNHYHHSFYNAFFDSDFCMKYMAFLK